MKKKRGLINAVLTTLIGYFLVLCAVFSVGNVYPTFTLEDLTIYEIVVLNIASILMSILVYVTYSIDLEI